VIRLAAIVSAVGLAALLAGCPAFYVDRGDVVAPSRSNAEPTVRALPPSNAYVDLRTRWQREIQIGLGGYAVATLIDPGLAAAELAHDAALEDMRGAELETTLENRWDALYGADRDRFPIDVAWRFDAQFLTNAQVLDPAAWSIVLRTSDGHTYRPLSTTVLSTAQTPQDGFWEGSFRLWFPWRDPVAKTPLLGGQNSWLSLALAHPSGSGAFTWRFRSGF
jgi:hypothetical protein